MTEKSIIDGYRQGMTIKQIAKELSVERTDKGERISLPMDECYKIAFSVIYEKHMGIKPTHQSEQKKPNKRNTVDILPDQMKF